MHRISTDLGRAICFAVFIATCVGGLATDGQVLGQQALPRILLGDETDEYESVGIVGSLRRGGFCTGTLITDSHVLTAAHCAEVIEGPTSGTFELFGRVYETIDVFIHPDYNRRTLDNDIAILQLKQPVTDVLPSRIFRGRPLVGDSLFIVGFGATGTADEGSDGSFGVKRVGVTTIDEVTATMVNWVFDDAGETNTAAGDSGGPGYLDIDGDLFVASVTAGGTEPDSSLGDLAINTRVDAFADWIDFTIAVTTEPQPDEPDQEPGQQPGDQTPADDGGCDSFWSCLFGVDEVRPFPILQLLIDLFTTILDWLNEIDAQVESDGAPPADPPETPGDQPPTSDPPATDPPTTDPAQPADCPPADQPTTDPPDVEEPANEAAGDPPVSELPPSQSGSGGVGGDGPPSDSVTLPPADASRLEIRRWMLRNPGNRHLVEDRL